MERERLKKSYRLFLKDELVERKGKNSHYSLRAFARDLGVSPTAMSEVLSERRHFSRRNLDRIADRLHLSPEEKYRMVNEVAGDFEVEDHESIRQLEEDTFKLMSEWYYFGILSLARLKNTSCNPQWIAKRLGISLLEAKIALDRLRRLGFVTTKNGKLQRTTVSLTTTTNVPSSAIRKLHKQYLELAKSSVETDPVENREINTMTMVIPPSKIKEAQRLMLGFRKTLSRFLEKDGGTEVYALAMQLFPLSRGGEKI